MCARTLRVSSLGPYSWNPVPPFFLLPFRAVKRLRGRCSSSMFDSELGESTPMSSWDAVYRLVKQIPRGRVITYGALAKSLRLPGGGRTAGRAMAACPSGKGVPWHRVVGAGGKLLIREPYASLQRKLLESEGVALRESRLNLKRHLWIPPKRAPSGRTQRPSRRASGKNK